MKQNETFGLVLIIGVLVIAMGSSGVNELTIADKFHAECIDLIDNEGDRNFDLYVDNECHEYPYNDGNGENITNSQNMFRQGSQNYDVYNDFFEYANYSYSDIVALTGYPGDLDDYYCDLYDNGAATYMEIYDIAFGTTYDDDINSWYNVFCVQGGNGFNNGGIQR